MAVHGGGRRPWGRAKFDIVSHSKNSITFLLVDLPHKNSFPSLLSAALTHTVTPYEWHISLGVTPLGKSPINLSYQVFWNLDGFREGSPKTVRDHILYLPFSGLRLETDQDGAPTGNIRGNRMNSTYDFWSMPRPLGVGLTEGETGYSDTFLISRSQAWSRDAEPVATLASMYSGVQLELYTDQDAVHLLTWNEKDGE
jgi:aldose 1-epimerase